jgi:hypothetical protein
MNKRLKSTFLLFLILFLASFLRLYRLPENLMFHGELGHNYLAIKNSIFNGQLPLLGPPTSHPWLFFGPLFYWIMGVTLFLGKGDPKVPAYSIAFISIISVFLTYRLTMLFFNKKTALVASYLMSISPLFIHFTRESRFFFFVIPLSLIYFILVYKVILKNALRYFLFLGLTLGTMLNFHAAPLYLFIALGILFYFTKINFSLKKWVLFWIGVISPNIPFLLYDSTHQFTMIKNLLLWIPYRFLGFIGLYPKNNISAKTVTETGNAFYQFISNSFVQNSGFFTLILLLLFGVYCILILQHLAHRFDKTYLTWYIIFIHTIVGFSALFIHQNIPLHYFLPIGILPILIASPFLSGYLPYRNNIVRLLQNFSILFFFVLLVLNFSYYFSSDWFYQPETTYDFKHPLPYQLQINIVKTIINEARGGKFNLIRVGPFDYYEGYYAQNYQYLLWLYGNEPVNHKAPVTFTVYENTNYLPDQNAQSTFFPISNLVIIKMEN